MASEAVQILFAIVFVGIPGTGKTTIGLALAALLISMGIKVVYLDQDMFIPADECDSKKASAIAKAEYLRQIGLYIAAGYSVILGKSHPTVYTREEVFEILRQHNVQTHVVVNLVPSDYDTKYSVIHKTLLERIQFRKTQSTLTWKEAPQALNTIFGPVVVKKFINDKNVVVAGFERPTEVKDVLDLPLETPVSGKVKKIVTTLQRMRIIPECK